MTDEQFVKQEKPGAHCIEWRGPHGLDNKCYYIYPDGLIFRAISRGWSTEDAAWTDARARLELEPPQSPTFAHSLAGYLTRNGQEGNWLKMESWIRRFMEDSKLEVTRQ